MDVEPPLSCSARCNGLDDDEPPRECSPAHDDKPKTTPVPRLQILAITLIQISEPITGTVIYPFVNQFVRNTGITLGDERKTGYYAGLIESVFFFAEALTVFQWGWLSDQLGRRPVLLIGPLGLAMSMLGFGLSTSFTSLLAFRFMQGMFNGNIGVSKSVLAENADETNIGDLFAMLPLMWSMGITVGPIIGGIFAYPADRWPEVFGRIGLLQAHPYFLPCAIAGSLALGSFLFASLALRETLPNAPLRQRCISWFERQKQQSTADSKSDATPLFDSHAQSDYGTLESCRRTDAISPKTSDSDTVTTGSTYKALLIRPLLLTYLNYFFIAFTEMAHNALIPLMYSTSVSLGGLGLDAYRIGLLMGTFGLVNATLQLKYLGRLIRNYGPRKVYIFSYAAFVICVGLFPVASQLCRQNGGMDWKVWLVVAIQLTAQLPILACYATMHILVVSNAPKGSMGASNGVAQMIASIMRSIAPTVATSLFSMSLERNLAGGYLVYYVLLVVIFVGIRVSFLLPHTLSPS